MVTRRRNLTKTTDKDPACSRLIFIAAAIDDYLRAFDLDTGKQYVFIAAGGPREGRQEREESAWGAPSYHSFIYPLAGSGFRIRIPCLGGS